MKIAHAALVIALGLMAQVSVAEAKTSHSTKTVAPKPAVAAAAPSAPAEQSCTQVVQQMKNEWKAVDFATPSKPSAVRVAGKLGHENSAAQISYMQGEIKKADADCKAGYQQAALQRVASIRDLLDSRGMSQETASAAMKQQ